MVQRVDILGTWRLVKGIWEYDGKPELNPVFGENPTGFLHYLPDGRVAVVTAFTGRKTLPGEDRLVQSDEDHAYAARTFDAYAGRFTFIEPGRVIHHIEVNSFQNDVGKDFVRDIKIEGNLLYLMPPTSTLESGVVMKRYVIWERVAGTEA